MRNNIEELAAEEDARLQEERWERTQGLFLILGWGLGLWGWYRFSQDRLGSGALAILLSLIFFALRWNASKAVRISTASFWVGLLAGGGLFTLYCFTVLPSFYWGNDPSFWLAVHAGAVVEPLWSPLAYLVGEAASFIFPSHVFTLLPVLSAFVTALALFVAAQEFLSHFRSKNVLNLFFVFLLCVVLGLSRPFWNAATMGIGLVSSLGLLLFLLQRHLLQLGKEQLAVSAFILGLLWSTHPLWGAAGTAAFLIPQGRERNWGKKAFPILLGLSPYFWIVLRREKFFPSWGGEHPFFEIFKNVQRLWQVHFLSDWSWPNATEALGLKVLILLMIASVLGLFNLFLGVEVSKKLVSPVDFWIWLFCGAGSLFCYSNSTDYLGVTSLWFATGVAGFLAFSFDRRAGLASGIGSKKGVGFLSLVGVLIACGLSWLPGKNYSRSQYFFPQQHAFNLVRPLGPQTVLVCDDSFEFYAGLEARWMEPFNQRAWLLNENYLDKRWYVAEWTEHQPEFLFSTITGPVDQILKSLILNNRDRWQIQWSRPELPTDWGEPEASPTVLTQLFQSQSEAVDPASFQYDYDFSLIPVHVDSLDERAKHYLSRYVEGFKALGQSLMVQQRYTDAIHAYDRAARLDPLDKEAINQLSQIYSQHNILEAAQLDDEMVIRTHPLAVDKMTESLDEAQAAHDESKAADCLGQLVHLNSELADAQYQLSEIYDHQGRTQEAKALLEASVQVNPKQVEAQLALGHSLEKAGDWVKAEEAFRSVIVVDPQNKEAQVELWKLLNKPESLNGV